MTSHLYNRNEYFGESLRVRPVRHDDSELEEALFRAVSLESRYRRMLSGGTKETREWIDSMTHFDFQHHMHFVVTAEPGDATLVGIRRDLRILNAQPH